MKTKLCLFAFFFALTSAFCRPVGVEVKRDSLEIVTDLPPLTIRCEVCDPKTRERTQPSGSFLSCVNEDGTKTEPGIFFRFGKEKLKLVSTTNVGAGMVDIYTKWDTTSSPTGRWTQYLNIPQELAQDLRVEVDGKTAFLNYDIDIIKKDAYFDDVSKISFKQESTGKVLFEVTGTLPRIMLWFNRDAPAALVVRAMTPMKWSVNLLDLPELKWQINFP